MVWEAPVSRSSGGRSAVSTISGTPAWLASSTAGCRFAAAVPEVHDTGTGRPERLARPSARKPADRSSMRTCRRSRPAAAARAKAKDSGAFREPGDNTASVTPAMTSSSTSTVAIAVEGFSDMSASRSRGHRFYCRQAFAPAVAGGFIGGRGRQQSRVRHRPAHLDLAVHRQQRVGDHVRGQQVHSGQPTCVRQLRQRRRQRDPSGDADRRRLQRREDTTTGSPMRWAISRQAATPPSGCTFRTAMSAASSATTR